MTAPADAVFFQDRPAAMVVSHERSGTHFMMNTLAKCYGYLSDPWLNLDPQDGTINYFHPPSVRDHLLSLATRPLATVVKSHHQAEFFRGELSRVCERYVVVVIYRNPIDTLLSFWRFLHRLEWFEGPKVDDPLTLARAEPCGSLLRYQTRQHPTMMHRWAAHVDGWLAAARDIPRVVAIRYEDLSTRYEETVRGMAGALGHAPQSFEIPSREESVVPGGPRDPTGRGKSPNLAALHDLCRATVGETMDRCGY